MSGSNPGRLRRLTLAAIVVGLLVRVAIAALAPLLPDEAYYWEWSRHLAAGYFDHPPAVAWLIAAGTALLGHTPIGVRLGSLIAGTGAIACVVAIARRLGGDEAGLRAAVLLLCMPLVIPGLAVATTDAPALFAIAAALLCIVIALDRTAEGAGSTAWWVAAGVAFGCGLLAKLTVGIVGAAVGAAFFLRPSLRRQLRSPGPWIAVLAAGMIATPLIWWNAGHGWISVRFQLSHGLGAPTRGSVLGRELSLVGSQFALVTPGIFLLAVASARRALGRTAEGVGPAPDATDGRFLLAAVGTLVFAFFAYSAIRRPVEVNWPAPALIAVVPLVAASSGLTLRRWFRPAIALGALLVVVALVQLTAPVFPLPARRDPVARAYGWATLATAADSARGALTTDPPRIVWLGADRYQDAAEIAFNAPRHPLVFALNLGGRRNQYDLWPSFAQLASAGDGLVIALDTGSSDVAERLRPHFASAEQGGKVALTRAGDTITVRQLWSFRGWRGSWPEESPGRR